jgi:hypothetical protein
MQFVKHGPDIPDSLLQAHEDGRVVFFCGAGIAYPAGLPGFQGLVDRIYKSLGTKLSDIEKRAYERESYDATLDLLERRIPGQRVAVRRALKKALKPKWKLKGALDTHAALLQLSRTRAGSVRLVTTNFDRIFQRVIHRAGQPIPTYPAPLLPIPKSSRWNGLVYLHGLLPDKDDASALNRLVVTAGDFGLAYLTERWAARFVSELFRNYVVCFVGYRINDPVMRYMMDALAADRMLGEITLQAYAFGDFRPEEEASNTIEWETKGVTPILYEVPPGTHDHSALHLTLKAWAETYRDGVQGKERIVRDYAITRPSASTRQDDFVGRMLWGISDESGLPAKRFAEFDPVPALDWLEAFSQDRYRHFDLPRFGVQPDARQDEKLEFCLVRRPAPYTKAPWMALVSGGTATSQWDAVLNNLAPWLTRHLNDPALILWLAERGGQLNQQFSSLVERTLEKLAKLEKAGDTTELSRIRSVAPNAIPEPTLRVLWRLMLAGRIKSHWRDLDLYQWKTRLSLDGFTASVRLELRELLTPKLTLKKPFVWEEGGLRAPPRPVDWDLTLAANYVHTVLKDLESSAVWKSGLAAMIGDLEQLLFDALDILQELGSANEKSDQSHWAMPSISPHWQNRDFREWTALIGLLRDAWTAVHETDPPRARYVAQGWMARPFPTFKRLALFAASRDPSLSLSSVDWLLADDGWWLWSIETRRETMRLLVLQGANLPDDLRKRLEKGILAGPPRRMFRSEIEAQKWNEMADDMIWLRLAKLAVGGASLGQDAEDAITRLAKDPQRKLADNERDEFSHWMSGTGDPDYERRRPIDSAPRSRGALAKWLEKDAPKDEFLGEDNWRETCSERFFASAFSLWDLSREQKWPVERWREALQAWSEQKNLLRSWRFVAPILLNMPADSFQRITHSVAWWLSACSKVLDGHQDIFVALSIRVLEAPHEDEVSDNEPVTQAINHPVGLVTQALLDYWFRSEPNDKQGLPPYLLPLLSKLCDTNIDSFIHGRVLLASRLIALFRVDQKWSEAFLLPLFNWQTSASEARGCWEGFLWAPRLYRPLFLSFKADFFETARHYSMLGGHGRQYAAVLTYAALEPEDTFTDNELQEAVAALPQEGLHEVAHTLVQAIESAGEKRELYWKNRVERFWHYVWPKSLDRMSKPISEELARLSIAARDEFPKALLVVKDWLQPLKHPYYVISLLEESTLCRKYPKHALALLDAIIGERSYFSDELSECLKEIVLAAPELENDNRIQRFRTYLNT